MGEGPQPLVWAEQSSRGVRFVELRVSQIWGELAQEGGHSDGDPEYRVHLREMRGTSPATGLPVLCACCATCRGGTDTRVPLPRLWSERWARDVTPAGGLEGSAFSETGEFHSGDLGIIYPAMIVGLRLARCTRPVQGEHTSGRGPAPTPAAADLPCPYHPEWHPTRGGSRSPACRSLAANAEYVLPVSMGPPTLDSECGAVLPSSMLPLPLRLRKGHH
jgi:hypothetical protein